MNVCVIGSGYVGLVAGAGFAEIGHKVRCVDIDEEKIAALGRGEIPIYEPGLEALCARNTAEGRLVYSTDVGGGVAFADVVLIAVGTPEREDGSADLTAVLDVAETVAENLDGFTVVACKSTVPVGTNERVRGRVAAHTDQPFAVVSNPEFLREGQAVGDFMNPPRVVVGTDDERAEKLMRDLYAPLYGYSDAAAKIIVMDPRSAEMTKYVANAFLATRITFINEMANLCEAVGADITNVRLGAGTDPRIGQYYLKPGCGYGGSCFPKDVQALLRTSREHEHELKVLAAVDAANDLQKLRPFRKLEQHFDGQLAGRRVAVWGLAFKSETDDIRESPSIEIVGKLLASGAEVAVHDPIAMPNFARIVTDKPEFADDPLAAADGAEALILVTDWQAYRVADLEELARRMTGKRLVIDGRNIWSHVERPAALTYEGIGLGTL
jgi:UDPglucose 6-dehydrogenase